MKNCTPACESDDGQRKNKYRHLNEHQRMQIITRVDAGEQKAKLAKEFGISRAAVTKMTNRRNSESRITHSQCNEDGSYPSRSSPYPMVPVDAAIAAVLTNAEPSLPITVPLQKALNCIAASDICSPENIPPFEASTMDGYAVVAESSVGELPVVGSVTAGVIPGFMISPGTAAYITTGAPIPPGADAVIKVEDTLPVRCPETGEDLAVAIKKGAVRGQNIRPIGSDIQKDQFLIKQHEVISAVSIGLLATVGITAVEIFSPPVVGVMSTGDELVDVGELTSGGLIVDSNRPMLLAAISKLGVATKDIGICVDTENLLEQTILEAFNEVDVLITSGGVSMGERDLIKGIMEKLGTVHFGRIFMKPGKPTTFATIVHNRKKKLFFGLPGNPVSCLVTLHLLVQPALKRLGGAQIADCLHPQMNVTLSHSLNLDEERPEYHRAIVCWDPLRCRYVATSTGRQASSRLLSCRDANALLCLPLGKALQAGESVPALIVGEMLPPSLGTSYHGGVLADMLKSETISGNAESGEKNSAEKQPLDVRVCLLTVSDRVSSGNAEDKSAPAIESVLTTLKDVNISIIDRAVVPDEKDQIQRRIRRWCDNLDVHLILTTGGTGFGQRDVTPEAVKVLLDRGAPGIVIAMMQASLQVTPLGLLSRPVAGMCGNCLIITLPGSPKAVKENLVAITPALPHALYLLQDVSHLHHSGKTKQSESKPHCDCR